MLPSRRRITLSLVLIVFVTVIDLGVWGGENGRRGGGTIPISVVVVAGVAVYLTLFLRWRHPLVIFGIQWVWSLIGLLLPAYSPFAGLLLSLYVVGRRLPGRVAVAAMVSCLVPMLINSYNITLKAPEQRVFSFMVTFALWLALVAGVWILGRVSYRSDLRAAAAEADVARESERAVRQERTRLAHELHDSVANAVTTMILQAAGARALSAASDHSAADERVQQVLASVEATGVQAMNELHRLLRLLQPRDDAADEEEGLIPSVLDITKLVDRAKHTGLLVEVSSQGHQRQLDPSVEFAGYRVVQEGLNNSAKYAGPAATAHVSLTWSDTELAVTVRDDGGLLQPAARKARHSYPEAISGGFGLPGLAERVRLIGGRLETGATSGGFLIRAYLPVISPPRPAKDLAPESGWDRSAGGIRP